MSFLKFMYLALFPLLLPMMELRYSSPPSAEAMLFILNAIQTVVSGLLRLKLQVKCEPFSKLTYLLLFWVWFKFDSLGLFLSNRWITVD